MEGNTSVSPSTCPECHKDDRTERLSALIAAGTSHTTGSASTSGYSVGARGLSLNQSSTNINMTTASALVRRFKTPNRPSALLKVLVAFIATLLVASAVLAKALSDWPASLAGLLIAYVVGWSINKQGLEERRRRQIAWDEASERLRSSYYCARDDVAFLPGSNQALPPEEFTRSCFERPAEREQKT